MPIRERFEIQIVDHEWGHGPFLAVSDRHDANVPRFSGRWGDAGYRLAEHTSGSPSAWFLWVWENPEPQLTVESIELAPAGAPIVVGAIALANGDEYPFVNQAGRPVRLVVTDPELASRDAVLDVQVDRGVATYPQPVPTADGPPRLGCARRSRTRGEPGLRDGGRDTLGHAHRAAARRGTRARPVG